MSLNRTDSSQESSYDVYAEDLSFKDLIRAWWTQKWIVAAFVITFGVLGVGYALSLSNTYTSSTVLSPAESSGSGALSQISGQLGGIASLAGISLGKAGSNKTAQALEIMQSWGFIEEFINEMAIAPKVFAGLSWSPDSESLAYDPEIYDESSQSWVRKPPPGKEAEPSSWELYKKFRGFLTISEKGSFTEVSITFLSPVDAKIWVEQLVKKINARLKAEAIREARENIAFLKQQVNQTSLASMQTVFYGLIEEQTKNLMLAEGSQEYVFKTVNEARVPEEKSGPKRALICIALAFLGGFLGSVFAVMLGLKKDNKL